MVCLRQTALKETSFRVVYGRDPPTLRSYEQGGTHVPAVDIATVDRDVFLADVRERLLQAQESAKRYYNTNHREIFFRLMIGFGFASPSGRPCPYRRKPRANSVNTILAHTKSANVLAKWLIASVYQSVCALMMSFMSGY